MAPPIGQQYGQFSSGAAPTPSGQQDPNLISNKEKQPQGTGYTNLQSILSANQGNQLGTAVTGAVTNAGNQTRQNLSSQQQTFGQGLQQAQTGLSNDQNTVNSGFQAYDTSGTVAPGAAQGFSDLRNAQYNGPQGLANSQQLTQQSQNAAQLGQMGQSAGGRQQLLSTVVGAPGYTQSQAAEDQLFLAPSQGALRSAGLQNQRLTGQVNQAVNSAQNAGTAQSQALTQLQQNAANGIVQRQGTVNNAIAGQVAQAQQQNTTQQANNAAFQNALNTYVSNPSSGLSGLQNAASAAGITPDQLNLIQQLQGTTQLGYNTISGTFGVPGTTLDTSKNQNINLTPADQLQQLFTLGNTDTSTSGNTTQQQINQQNALASLAGTPQSYQYQASTTAGPQLNKNVAEGLANADITNLQNQYIDPSQSLLDQQFTNVAPAQKQQYLNTLQNQINTGGTLGVGGQNYAQLQSYESQLAALQQLANQYKA